MPKKYSKPTGSVTPGLCFESMEERRRRLRPDLYTDTPPRSAATPAASSSTSSSMRPPLDPAARASSLSKWIVDSAPSSSPTVAPCQPPLTRPAPHVTRADAPVVRHIKRGSATLAVARLNERGLDSLVDDLRHDKVARTSAGPNASTWKTWQSYHEMALGPEIPKLPITPDILVAIGAVFKGGEYRSFPNYASSAKNQHVEARHEWTQLLEHTRCWVTRSVLRGIGPARQSCSFKYRLLLRLPQTADPLHASGPLHPVRFTLLSVAFLLREVEASTAVFGSWAIDAEAMELTWLLPASKSDHMALGVSRTWPCICGLDTLACPFHMAVAHREWLITAGHPTDPRSPLFPTSTGRHPDKHAVVSTFEQLGTQCGQPLTTVEGNTLFGGHSARVTGSQLLAVHGLEVQKIRILARHSGDTILRYVAEAPLKSLRTDLGLPGTGTPGGGSFGPPSPGPSNAALRRRISKLESAITSLRGDMQTQAQDVVALATGYCRTDDRVFIQNVSTATVHVARAGENGYTLCSWRYATSVQQNGCRTRTLRDITNVPGTMLCDVCLKTERAIAMSRLSAELSGDEY